MISYSLGLNYYTSAGIITLLTLQDTTKETIVAAFKKVGIFFLSVLIAFLIFKVFSYNPFAYGMFLLVFISSCHFIKVYDAIPINAVLVTHFLLEENMSLETITNEGLLMIIGAGIGILLNIYIPSNVRYIKKQQKIIEKGFIDILNSISDLISNKNESPSIEECFESLKLDISRGLDQAQANKNNTFFKENRYFTQYMELRCQQFSVLEEIYSKIKTLSTVPAQAHEVAFFIKEISQSFSESQIAKGLLDSLEDLLLKFKESSLPITREEFENRAILYMLLMDLKVLLRMKKNFADSLSKEQIELYWKEQTQVE